MQKKNNQKLILSRFSIVLSLKLEGSGQTDEEKQRERQRNERELKHAELEAQHLKVVDRLFELLCKECMV